jgi:DNA polymerase I-like protein with 3'-5' exonuclease and polymerase domains
VFKINRECRDATRNSILFGCRPILFIHDEIIVEIPEDNLMHERSRRVAELMVEGMTIICPDVPIKAEPLLMRSWHKDAEPIYDEKNRLAIWTPRG